MITVWTKQEMTEMLAASRWKAIYTIVGLIVMAELVIVSGRGHIDYQSSFGPKERRKRQGVSSFTWIRTIYVCWLTFDIEEE